MATTETTTDKLTAHVEQVATEKHASGHVDKETADLMTIAIKESKLRLTSRASLQFFGFLFVAYCSRRTQLASLNSSLAASRLTMGDRFVGYGI